MVTSEQYKKTLRTFSIVIMIIYILITIVNYPNIDVEFFIQTTTITFGIIVIYIWFGIFLIKWEMLDKIHEQNTNIRQCYVTKVEGEVSDE